MRSTLHYGKNSVLIFCFLDLLHSGERCRCFEGFCIFVSPETCDGLYFQVEVDALNTNSKEKSMFSKPVKQSS